MREEDKIRESLAARLELLERGLTLRNKEVPLPNAHGAAGRIDILACDTSNNYVVIEIKRSDQAARQAVHEFFKYTSLLQKSLGIPKHRIRCFLVSTVWHELLVPFSELTRIKDYEVRGFKILLGPGGLVLGAEPVQPLPEESVELEFNDEQDLYLFEHEDQRMEFMSALLPKLRAYDYVDFAALIIDHGKQRHNVFPFGVYLAATVLSDESEERILESLEPDNPFLDPDASADGPWTLNDALMLNIRRSLFGKYTDWDRGTPSKFIGIANDWVIRETARVGGRIERDAIFTDNDIHRRIAKTDGGNRFSFQFIGRPQHVQSWRHATASLKSFLGRCSAWTEPLIQYLHAIAQEYPAATVSLNAFNTLTIIPSIHPVLRENGATEPFLEVVVDTGSYIVSVHGVLEWSGEPMTLDPVEAFPGPLNVLAPRTMEYEQDLARHHFTASLFEFLDVPVGRVRRIVVTDGKMMLQPLSGPIRRIDDFARENPGYLAQIARSMKVMLANPRRRI